MSAASAFPAQPVYDEGAEEDPDDFDEEDDSGSDGEEYGASSRPIKRARTSEAKADPNSDTEEGSHKGKRKKPKGKGGSSCHQCKSRRNFGNLIYCTGQLDKKNKRCRKKFCAHCLKKFYKELEKNITDKDSWKCPSCRKICCCAACRRRKTRAPGTRRDTGAEKERREQQKEQRSVDHAHSHSHPRHSHNHAQSSAAHAGFDSEEPSVTGEVPATFTPRREPLKAGLRSSTLSSSSSPAYAPFSPSFAPSTSLPHEPQGPVHQLSSAMLHGMRLGPLSLPDSAATRLTAAPAPPPARLPEPNAAEEDEEDEEMDLPPPLRHEDDGFDTPYSPLPPLAPDSHYAPSSPFPSFSSSSSTALSLYPGHTPPPTLSLPASEATIPALGTGTTPSFALTSELHVSAASAAPTDEVPRLYAISQTPLVKKQISKILENPELSSGQKVHEVAEILRPFQTAHAH